MLGRRLAAQERLRGKRPEDGGGMYLRNFGIYPRFYLEDRLQNSFRYIVSCLIFLKYFVIGSGLLG